MIHECSRSSFLFSDVEPWMLYSPQYPGGRWRSVYLVTRVISALYFFIWLILSGALPGKWYVDESQKVKWFVYLTNWCFLMFNISLSSRAICNVYCFVRYRDSAPQKVPWYLKLNWIMYSMSTSLAVVVSILFWGLSYTQDYPLQIEDVHTHGVNAVYILCIDFWITAMPVRILHIWIPLMFTLVYIIFTVVYDYVGGTNANIKPYIYSGFDWTNSASWPAVYSTVALVSVTVVFSLLFGLYQGRLALYNNLCCQTAEVTRKEEEHIMTP